MNILKSLGTIESRAAGEDCNFSVFFFSKKLSFNDQQFGSFLLPVIKCTNVSNTQGISLH